MSRSVRLYLIDMMEACDRIIEYTSASSPAQFAADRMKVDAVTRNVEVLGEAAKHVPEDVRKLSPAIPWAEITGMRDVVIHDYFGVDIDIVSDVAFKHVPALRDQLAQLLPLVTDEP